MDWQAQSHLLLACTPYVSVLCDGLSGVNGARYSWLISGGGGGGKSEQVPFEPYLPRVLYERTSSILNLTGQLLPSAREPRNGHVANIKLARARLTVIHQTHFAYTQPSSSNSRFIYPRFSQPKLAG